MEKETKIDPILNEVTKILRDYKGKPNLEVNPQMNFAELELDSLDTVDLVMEIEDKMGVSIEMNKDIQTVGHIIDIIKKQKEDKK